MKRLSKATKAILVIALLIPMAASACAEDPPARTASEARQVKAAGIYIQSPDTPEAAQLTSTLRGALIHDGYRLVLTQAEPHEIDVELNVSLRETHGLLQVYVNGELKKSFVADATFEVKGNGQVLGAKGVEYDAEDGPSDDNVQALLAALDSATVQQYIVQARRRTREQGLKESARQQVADYQKETAQLALKEEEQKNEQASWNQVVLTECTNPTNPTGCDSVKEYLAEYPTGRHVVEAKQALESGTPLMARLADEQQWTAARPDDCKNATAQDACDNLRDYVAAQPVGAHVAEARALLKETGKRLEQTEAARLEQQRGAQRQRQASGRQKARVQRCVDRSCAGLTASAFEPCKARCDKECK